MRRADSQLKRAVRALPRWSQPVGVGAKRTVNMFSAPKIPYEWGPFKAARGSGPEKPRVSAGWVAAGEGALGGDAAGLDDDVLVADFLELGDEMRTDKNGLAFGSEFQEELADAFNAAWIESREGLVDDEEIGADEQVLEIGEFFLVAGRIGVRFAAEERGIKGEPAGDGLDCPRRLPGQINRRLAWWPLRSGQPRSHGKKAGRSGT